MGDAVAGDTIVGEDGVVELLTAHRLDRVAPEFGDPHRLLTLWLLEGMGWSGSPGGRGPWMRRSARLMGTSLMLASRRLMWPWASNSQFSLP